MAEQPTPLATRVTRRGIFEDDWRARVTPARPWPVVLLHGTGHSKGLWADLGGELRADGWAVFAPDYGFRATNPLRESLDQLAPYLEAVLAATGGERVILCGHSQGGLLATLLSFGMPERVRHVVCLAAPNHGTRLGGRAAGLLKVPGAEQVLRNLVVGVWGPSALDQIAGSELTDAVAARDVTAPGVTYTCIATRTDQLISPPSSCFLDDGGAGVVQNIMVQDVHPRAVVLHEEIAGDRRVRRMVRDALDAVAAAG
ncbi:hypothetical protein CSPHI_10335 [Corynebacterium sphenisci DSM 44792]|uniref:AB hydrolase-1 domain-containing protein n=1 Tax=Corynebacterium sphenisci DSM 44792 TaxID=1437874 RepID=A0A1L7CZP5_9CORY|nr:alpha/beta fold hydrolase [Corynebacterium sphenisci]APT91328.1 hypothetical protein CSPHI_10335 [Corynebacterium sphenisci DSM 44792]